MSHETVHMLSSLDTDSTDANDIKEMKRKYWRIESDLHYQLDNVLDVGFVDSELCETGEDGEPFVVGDGGGFLELGGEVLDLGAVGVGELAVGGEHGIELGHLGLGSGEGGDGFGGALDEGGEATDGEGDGATESVEGAGKVADDGETLDHVAHLKGDALRGGDAFDGLGDGIESLFEIAKIFSGGLGDDDLLPQEGFGVAQRFEVGTGFDFIFDAGHAIVSYVVRNFAHGSRHPVVVGGFHESPGVGRARQS